MSEVIMFPDPIELLGTYLQDELTLYGMASPVSVLAPDNDRPGPKDSRYVRLMATEMPAGKTVMEVQIIADAYGDGAVEALALARLTSGILLAAPEYLADVYTARLAKGPYEAPDPRTGMTRYPLTVTLRIRGAALARPSTLSPEGTS